MSRSSPRRDRTASKSNSRTGNSSLNQDPAENSLPR